MKWARGLIISGDLELEKRVLQILQYLLNIDAESKCNVSDLDATGFLGNILTKQLNENKNVQLALTDVIKIFQEDAQVFEMELSIYCMYHSYLITIRDGASVDVLGDSEELPDIVLGDFTNSDPSLFRY